MLRANGIRQVMARRTFFGIPDQGVKGKAFIEFEQNKISHAGSTTATLVYPLPNSYRFTATLPFHPTPPHICRDGSHVEKHLLLHRRAYYSGGGCECVHD